MRKLSGALLCLGVGIVFACGTEDGSTFGDGNGDNSSGGNNSSGGFGKDDGGSDSGDLEGDGAACKTSDSDAALQPIYLGFAFDVSGSMGQLDCPFWSNDPVTKWRPVVEATGAFFEDAASTNINASLTLFPDGTSERCDATRYGTPGVSMRVLPSTAFATALRAYETAAGLPASGKYTLPMPPSGANWRGGTPTRAAVTGVLNSLRQEKTRHPDARIALVLVTDGAPQGCGADDAIANVNQVVTNARTVDGIPTYVIGVKDPATPPASPPWSPGGTPAWACQNGNGSWMGGYSNTTTPKPTDPAALTNLNSTAAAGGTTAAVLLDTGTPQATKDAFTAAINKIRSSTVSCKIKRPDPPAGQTFDPNRVNVRYESGTTSTPLVFDAECKAANAWRYESGGNSVIELCAATCDTVRKDPKAKVKVEFGCLRRGAVN